LVTLNRPDALDTRDLGQILTSVSRLDLDGSSVELAVLAANLVRKVLTAVEEAVGLDMVNIILVL
jgi:hypothetical protein